MELDAWCIARSYLTRWLPGRGIDTKYTLGLDRDFCHHVADWYDNVRSDPGNEHLLRLYDVMASETRRQYEAMIKGGVVVEPWLQGGQPYSDSGMMQKAIARTNKVYVYLTSAGHGSTPPVGSHPMRVETDVRLFGITLLRNDLFRAVHDFFAHYMGGNNFSTEGEFHATHTHSRMYSEAVYPILLAETVGQICWFYYGPHLRTQSGEFPRKGDKDYLPLRDRPFPQQKVVGFPDDFVELFFRQFSNGGLMAVTTMNSDMRDRIQYIRQDFPMFRTSVGEQHVFLDNAATTQKPQVVLDAITSYYTTINSNVGRGFYKLSLQSSDAYEHARRTVQQFINAQHSHEIVFTKNTTDSVNLIASMFGQNNVAAGDNIVITGLEHHSNLLPWRRLCEMQGAELRVLDITDGGMLSVDRFIEIIDDRTKLLAVGHVSNVLGTINPVRELIAVAHERGIVVLVDGAQAVARRRVDVQELDADFYCFSGHKIYGPMGIGVLYGKESLLEQFSPCRIGGGVVRNVTTHGPIDFKALPDRLEAGTPDVCSAVGLEAAIDYLTEIGLDWVAEHDAALTDLIAEMLGDIEGGHVYGPQAPHRAGSVSFGIDGLHPHDIGTHLSGQEIFVRTGVHCAVPLLDRMDLVGTVRASVGIYNTPDEIETLGKALRTVQPGVWTRERATMRHL